MSVFSRNKAARLNVLSNGGGTQSCALICLIAQGVLPKPDLVVMADTERESSNVITYQQQYIQPLCESIGLEYHLIRKSDYTDADLMHEASGKFLPGYYTEWEGRRPDGNVAGKHPGYCSSRWKKEVVERFLNRKYGELALTRRGVNLWLGMSFDEPRRIKVTEGKWQRLYPLFELRVTREEAIKIVEKHGLPTPPRSACWMCPNRSADEWLRMKAHVPEDFAKACAHENVLQQTHPHLWLTRQGIPLAEAVLNMEQATVDTTPDLTQFCDSGMCFV